MWSKASTEYTGEPITNTNNYCQIVSKHVFGGQKKFSAEKLETKVSLHVHFEQLFAEFYPSIGLFCFEVRLMYPDLGS
jgi:hypothetical protein